MKRTAITILSLLASASISQAIIIIIYDFEENITDPATNDLSPMFTETGLTASDFSGGSLGLATNTPNATTNQDLGLLRGTQDDMPDAIASDQYFSFTVTADAMLNITLESLTFDVSRSAGGAQDYAIRSSVDDFGANIVFANDAIGTTATNQDIDLSAPAYNNLTTIEFRIYFDDRASNGTSNSETTIDNVILNGSIIAIPEPSSTMLLGLGSLLFMIRRRN